MPRVIARSFSYRLRIIAPLFPEATQRLLIKRYVLLEHFLCEELRESHRAAL